MQTVQVSCVLFQQLYMTCGGTSKGISFRDVMVVLVLITKGTVDEKVRCKFLTLFIVSLYKPCNNPRA